MADNRCDMGLPNGKRCKNDALHWVRTYVTFSESQPPELWPLAVCDLHAIPPADGMIHRMGPDRRNEYADAHKYAVVTAVSIEMVKPVKPVKPS